MASTSFKIPNAQNELLDVFVEGNDHAHTTVIFVHGFGTDKHETGGLFDDIAASLTDRYRLVRFDFSAYGQSQGNQEEGNYKKWSQDLERVISWTNTKFPGHHHILAQSMGCFVTLMLSPKNIDKTVFMGIPNANSLRLIEGIKAYFGSRGVVFDESGITHIPRSSGQTQKLGPSFWQVIREFHPVFTAQAYAQKSQLLILHPKDDEIIGNDHLDVYQHLPNTTFKVIPGNHSLSDPKDRQTAIRLITSFFNQTT